MGSPYSEEECKELNGSMESLTEKVLSQFASEGIPANKVEITRSMSIRYKMQVHEIEVEIKEDIITPGNLQDTIIPRFEDKYADIFGAGTEAKEAGTEILTCKVSGRYYQFVLEEANPERFVKAGKQKKPKPKGKREVFFEEEGQLKAMDTEIFDGDIMAAGDILVGPSIVERYGDAIVIPPGYRGEVDSLGTIALIRVG